MQKHGLKAFGVALMAGVGLIVLFAVGAQGANLSDGGQAGKFRVEGSSALVIGSELQVTEEGSSQFLISSKNAYIECKTGKSTSGEGISESKIKVTFLFEECATFEDSTKKTLAACDILGEPGSTGKFQVAEVFVAKLHEGQLYVLVEVDGTTKFGPECGIGVKVLLSGSVVGLVDNGAEQVVHLITFSEAIQKLFQVSGVGDKLLYGAAAEMFLNYSINLKLFGTHAGRTWSVI